MRYNVFVRDDDRSRNVSLLLEQSLEKQGFERNEHNPDIVFTVGGDGTVLKAIHHYIDTIEDVTFVGIHTGRLGFYADFTPAELDTLLKNIRENHYYEVEYPLLKATVCGENECQEFYALNEVTLINAFHTQHIDVYIDDLLFESFRGTGLCISTPTGSSAYNKSLGGALVHPLVEAFQLTEMGSINSNVYRTIGSPVLLPKKQKLTLRSPDFTEVTITADHLNMDIKGYNYIECTLSTKKVRFRRYKQKDFWNRVKKSFL